MNPNPSNQKICSWKKKMVKAAETNPKIADRISRIIEMSSVDCTKWHVYWSLASVIYLMMMDSNATARPRASLH